MTRSETLLNPEEKPQEEKNTRRCSSWSEGSAPTGCLHSRFFVLKARRRLAARETFQVPKPPLPEEESSLLRESRAWALAALVILVLVPSPRPLAALRLRGHGP